MRLKENTRCYLRELDVYQERMAPGAKISRMIDRRCKEQELYLYEPMQYWDQDQQGAMHAIIRERFGRILPGLAESWAAGHGVASDEAVPESESDDEQFSRDAESRRRETQRRKQMKSDLQASQDHQKAMASIADETQRLEGENQSLLQQIETMRAAVKAADAELHRLSSLEGKLASEAKSSEQRRNMELQQQAVIKAQNAAKQQQQQEAEANAAAAIAADACRSIPSGSAGQVQASTEAPKPRAPDQAELKRRLRELVKAAEAEQAQERGKLEARINQLVEAIAKLKAQLDNRETLQSLHERGESAKSKFPLEKVMSAKQDHGNLQSQDATSQVGGGVPSGEVVITKHIAPRQKARRIFEKLHEDASDRVTRFVARKSVHAGVDVEKHAPCAQLLAAESQLPVSRSKAKSTNEALTQLKVARLGTLPERPSSAAEFGLSGKPKRASSATTKRTYDAEDDIRNYVGFGRLHMGAVGAARTSETATSLRMQKGASVLYSRLPPDLAGPARKSLLRATLEEHYRDVAAQ
jgi:hypothetical protein